MEAGKQDSCDGRECKTPFFYRRSLFLETAKPCLQDKLFQLEEAGEALPSVQSTPAKAKIAPTKKPTPEPVKKGVKRSSNGEKAQGRKRQKKEASLVPEDENEDSALTSIEDTPEETEDSYVSDAPEPKKSKKSAAKPVARESGKQKVNEGKDKKMQEAGIGDRFKIPDSKSTKKASAKEKLDGDDSDAPSKESSDFGDGVKGDVIKLGGEVTFQSDSEISVVLGEAPKRKKKSKSTSKGQLSPSTSKSSKLPKATKPPPDLSPDEAELKTLQSQLAMCGVRKIWGVVLKNYGSDTKAKIRHLKGMLKDIGMEGRFSKQKAEEIKEARELQADLEAVKEGDAIWGMGSGARSKKVGGGKKVTEPSDNEEEDGVAIRSKSVSEKPPARLARAKMDLAFLGDESESDD